MHVDAIITKVSPNDIVRVVVLLDDQTYKKYTKKKNMFSNIMQDVYNSDLQQQSKQDKSKSRLAQESKPKRSARTIIQPHKPPKTFQSGWSWLVSHCHPPPST